MQINVDKSLVRSCGIHLRQFQRKWYLSLMWDWKRVDQLDETPPPPLRCLWLMNADHPSEAYRSRLFHKTWANQSRGFWFTASIWILVPNGNAQKGLTGKWHIYGTRWFHWKLRWRELVQQLWSYRDGKNLGAQLEFPEGTDRPMTMLLHICGSRHFQRTLAIQCCPNLDVIRLHHASTPTTTHTEWNIKSALYNAVNFA